MNSSAYVAALAPIPRLIETHTPPIGKKSMLSDWLLNYMGVNMRYENGSLFWTRTGSGRNVAKPIGAVNANGYLQVCIRVNGERRNFSVHRLIYLLHNKHLPEQIDHIDGDRTNNSIENLRPASLSENMWNQKALSKTKSGIKGVSLEDGRWRVRVQANGKVFRATLEDKDLAELVATEARELMHGKYARHT